MNYRVVLTNEAKKALKKLDRNISAMILAWIRKNLEDCENPRQRGKGLTGNRSGQWRYRIGDYRIISDISDSTITILVLAIAHRREVYDD